jgi:hypothetical protein
LQRTGRDRCALTEGLTRIDRCGVFLETFDMNAFSCAKERGQAASTTKDREPSLAARAEEREFRRDCAL